MPKKSWLIIIVVLLLTVIGMVSIISRGVPFKEVTQMLYLQFKEALNNIYSRPGIENLTGELYMDFQGYVGKISFPDLKSKRLYDSTEKLLFLNNFTNQIYYSEHPGIIGYYDENGTPIEIVDLSQQLENLKYGGVLFNFVNSNTIAFTYDESVNRKLYFLNIDTKEYTEMNDINVGRYERKFSAYNDSVIYGNGNNEIVKYHLSNKMKEIIGKGSSPTMDKSGNFVAFQEEVGGKKITIKDLRSNEEWKLEISLTIKGYLLSPDGNYIAVTSGGGILEPLPKLAIYDYKAKKKMISFSRKKVSGVFEWAE